MTRCSASPRALFCRRADRRHLSPEHRFKTRAEMIALFADLPEATEAQRRDRAALRLPAADPQADPAAFLRPRRRDRRRRRGAAPPGARGARRAASPITGSRRAYARDDYDERLAFELDVIVKMKFPGYFLIVADFIKWAKAHDIPVGPGRGSGAGSLVA